MKSTKEKLTILTDLWEELGLKPSKKTYQNFIDLTQEKAVSIKKETYSSLSKEYPNLNERISSLLERANYNHIKINKIYDEILNNHIIVSAQEKRNSFYYRIRKSRIVYLIKFIPKENNKFRLKTMHSFSRVSYAKKHLDSINEGKKYRVF